MSLLSKFSLKDIWAKYGLIVVGNIVFFLLLYLFSYRPHNKESRAAEFLSLAQLAETNNRHQTAVDLYEKIVEDYEGTRASMTAEARLPDLSKKLAEKPPCPVVAEERCEAMNLEEMLRKGPAVYIATHLARHFDRVPDDRAKLTEIIWKYLKMAHEWGKMPVRQLRDESEFQKPVLQKTFFELKPKCVMEPDWWYDDFYIENGNFYAWTGASVSVVISQGDVRESAHIRLDDVASGEQAALMEFRVRRDGGPVQCRLTLTTGHGSVTVAREL